MVHTLLLEFGYVAVFGLLFAAGLAVPVPEEATQLAAGVLAYQGYLSFVPALVACWLGIVSGDLVWFVLARRHGERVLSSRPISRFLTAERRARIEDHLARHAFLSVAVARHTSGLRLAAFALAATHGVRVRTFVLADGLSAMLSVPLVVGAGYLFSEHVSKVHQDIRRIELGILAAVGIAIAIAVVVRRRRSRGA
jgi:membrane protein DedA with SNARE-associated domain